MKKIIVIIALMFATIYSAENNSFSVILKNPTDVKRVDELVVIKTDDLIKMHKNFNPKSFHIKSKSNLVPFQVDSNLSGSGYKIKIVVDLEAKETKALEFVNGKVDSIIFKKRTYAGLEMKVNAPFYGGMFHGTSFQDIKSIKVPANHVEHDALFKFEGPGWESEKTAYRFYLDSRNTNDIFGKKLNKLVLKDIAKHDTVKGNDNDSYQFMQDWGMDIFKVGNSLGIGSLGMLDNNKVIKVSKADSVICKISSNGVVQSEIQTNYYGWNVGDSKYSIVSKYIISAGDRLTRHVISVDNSVKQLVTGIVKHKDTDLLVQIPDKGWGYIATYGKQVRALENDKMGLVVLYNKGNFEGNTEDSASLLVKLKPNGGKLTYYFGYAWEQEQNGIRSKEEFKKYLDDTVIKLNNPLVIEIN